MTEKRKAELRGSKTGEPLFPIVDARKTLSWIDHSCVTNAPSGRRPS